ncbi:hypothetical protein EDB81DRAFT_756713 [Dactylonectria macrodidyma]|uniref:SH3 domain-containing protein n=1 Tax=Dactylonectria macrodidyma TaxID=307937 RepID=A0A9P9F9A0_9HYPO|nr:hypothetical protein EDB81DRAFT_756713 [Dactylonectria macrodidyma]
MSTTSVPATPPVAAAPSSSPNPNHPALPPLITSPASRRSTLSRPMSYASKNRLSQYSTGSAPSRSRPTSHLFPVYPSSLSYTLVRDFAYPVTHHLHYGPPPEPSRPPSGMTTPASEHRRLSDPSVSWEQKMPWDSWAPDGYNRGHDIAPIHFGDGPPYSEDEDLQSPVVATRHRSHKSTSAAMGSGRGRSSRNMDSHTAGATHSANYDNERGFYVGTSGDGSERYYVNHGGEANGPGGEYVTYPPDQARHSRAYHVAQQPNPAEGIEYYQPGSDASSPPSSPGFNDEDQSRYSRDYQFTITSPDEEFHGKAVALFDFERENENELPLKEGQIIWVSYRHGQGWLVAEDPKTEESGLVPEEYVRLLRDIEGGMNSLTGHLAEGSGSPNDVGTPTQAEHSGQYGHTPTSSNATNGYHQPIVSMFSTSSKDLDLYPTQQLGLHSQAPPQVVHYHGQRGGSQANTPTIPQHHDVGMRRESQDAKRTDANTTPVQEKPSVAIGEEKVGEVVASDGDR